MGEHDVEKDLDPAELRRFSQALLRDLQALERMLEEGRIESGVRRIGAEQEVFLVGDRWRPAPVATELLERLGQSCFTTELGRFNLEINLEPIRLEGRCFSALQERLSERLESVRAAAQAIGAEVVLTGILPTLVEADLDLANMSPVPRYFALNEAMSRLRGDDYELFIQGLDELRLRHSNIMLEACNTSFQVHLQIDPEDFAHRYNVAQATAGPVLAAAVNSPLFFGRRLWAETRIPLFQQSVDTRSPTLSLRQQSPRVSFGRRWVEESVLEIYREDVASFPVLLGAELEEDPFVLLDSGAAPSLKALALHNGTIYRWNRPCYGVSEGKPHLRIENRMIPSGPTVIDEVANAALWIGVMEGAAAEYEDVTRVLRFDQAKENFHAAARQGLAAQLYWTDGVRLPAEELIRSTLLPLARQGLESSGVDADDVDRYLGIVGERIGAGRTGSSWFLDSYAAMPEASGPAERMAALTAAAVEGERSGEPIARWPLAGAEEGGAEASSVVSRVRDLMTTDVFTLHPHQLVDLAACLMDWQQIRHVPVEDERHRLVGLVTYRTLLRHLTRQRTEETFQPIPVSDVMIREVVTVAPETPAREAIRRLQDHGIGCLPVVEDGRLVGIVSERDFLGIARAALEPEAEP